MKSMNQAAKKAVSYPLWHLKTREQVGVAMGQRGTEVAKVHRQWKFRETPETQIFLTWDNVYLQYLAMLQYTY